MKTRLIAAALATASLSAAFASPQPQEELNLRVEVFHLGDKGQHVPGARSAGDACRF